MNGSATSAATSTARPASTYARRSPPRRRLRSENHPASGGTTIAANAAALASTERTMTCDPGANCRSAAGTAIVISAAS